MIRPLLACFPWIGPPRRAPLRAPILLVVPLLLAGLPAPPVVHGMQDPPPQEVEVPDTLPPVVDPALGEAAVEGIQLQAAIQDLMAIFRRIDGLREVRITIEDRILELRGTALSQADRVQAGELAAEVPGIIWVDNRITVETDLRRRLAPAADRFRERLETGLRFIPSLFLGLLLIAGSFFLAYLAGRWLFPPRRGDRNPFARNLLRQTVRAIIGLAGILLALELMAATALVGAVLGAAGVAGIAIGFAFRDIVENYLAGALLSLRQPFFQNDFVEMDGHEGRIARLTGRETILMTLDGNHVRIPNATVFKSVMTNFTRNPRRRFMVEVGIAPEESIGSALRLGRETLAALPGVLEEPGVAARVHALGDSTVTLRFTGWVDQSVTDFGKVRSQAIRSVKESFEAAGIATPPPEYGVRILGGTPDSGGGFPSGEERSGSRRIPATDPGDGDPADRTLDLAPDRTIEVEIAREMAESEEEDLLNPPPPPKDEPPSR